VPPLFIVDSSSNLDRLRELEELVDIDFRDEEESAVVVCSMIEIENLWYFSLTFLPHFFLLALFPFDLSSF
jgi:hypothetical protein